MSERGHTGRLVGGRFELLARLGAGGMGTVWRARDLQLHREVALKEVRPADAALHEHSPQLAEQQRERVLRESRALARLQHPNVVSIYQILDHEDSPYPWIVMELVRGTSLEDRLRQGPLSPQEAARIGRGVLGALRAAHAAGIHHRDVKPGNVLLRPDGSAVLTDFGIAALRDSATLTATGEVIGSPEYMAPERLHGDETRTASDLWSLAMLLYVAVEGYHPMRRASTMATLAAVMTEPVPPPRRAGPLTGALSSVLVPDPAARPDGEQLDRMLAAVEAGHGTPPAGQAYGTPYPTPPSGSPSGSPSYPTPPSGGPAYPAQQSAPQAYPAPYPGSAEPPARRSKAGVVASVVAMVAIVALAAVVVVLLRNQAAPGDDNAAGSPGTTVTTPSGFSVPDVPATGGGDTTAEAPADEDLLTPKGARAAVAALAEEMKTTRVSELILYPDYARAVAPTTAVQNGFDDFEYRAGVASRTGADGVDADRATLDLDDVKWDTLPGLWNRAKKDLGIAKPTLTYIVIQTDIIDGEATMSLYMTDDYGAAYLQATLAGKVLQVYSRGG
jgi:serine/threonine protein kinase